MTTKRRALLSRDDTADLVMFLASLAGLLAVNGVTSGVDPRTVWFLSALGTAGGAYAFVLQKKVTKDAKREAEIARDETPPDDARYMEDLRDEVARLQRDNATLLTQRIAEAHAGETLPAYAVERAKATEEAPE